MGRKRWRLGLVVVAGLLFGAGTYWFAPWKLVVDERVAEAAPAAPRVIAGGLFRGLEHETSGSAMVLESGGGLMLRLEDLRTSNGPDLAVILSPTAASEDSWTAYGQGDIVVLGALKGNLGSQNYTLPAGIELGRYRSAVIWCRRFHVAFGAAPLSAR